MGIIKQGRPTRYRVGDDKPPASPGLYTIRDDNGNVLYSGETNNLGRRAKEHQRRGMLGSGQSFDFQVADGRSTSRTRRELEKQRISQLSPPQNQSSGGEGRTAT